MVPKPPKPFNGNKNAFKKKKKPTHEDEETLTFEQKKQLSETIQTLDGGRLERVLEIIDEVYPEIREVCFVEPFPGLRLMTMIDI